MMDFMEILNVAQKNESEAKQHNKVACYSTKYTAPKKETKQSKALSDNIKKFLARREEEERQKQLEEKKKKENLLSMRDQKTQNRINKHLKVCKAANKAVLADAVDNENTAITIAGPSQPDEDDYGYTSQEASEYYNRLMEKYNKMPAEKPLFSDAPKKTIKDISSTKDRVKQALKMQEIEDTPGHRRKRKSNKDSDAKNDKSDDEDKFKEKDKEKSDKDAKSKIKRKPAPPPIDFVSLLKLAEKKQYEPIMIEVKPKQEEERPMTKKQQKEYQKEKEWRERRERQKLGLDVPKPSTPEVKSEKSNKLPTSNKVLKINSEKEKVNSEKSNAIKRSEEKPMISSKKPMDKPVKMPNVSSNIISREKDKEREKDKARNDISEERRKLEAEKRELEEMRKKLEEEKKKLMLSKTKYKAEESKSKPVAKVNKEPIRNSTQKPAMKDIKPRQFPPPDVRPLKRPQTTMKKKMNKRRIESDDEYDSELDDFIVDEEEGNGEDYSKYISEIFNYDKNKYRLLDDDDDAAMESNFARQLKEEFVSTKIGIMEDLEDIRREKMMEARRKKIMMNKKMRK